MNKVSVTLTSSYDDYGNPTMIQTKRGDLTERQTFHYVQKGSWCLNKPDTIRTVKRISSDTQTRTVAYEYDSKGNLTKETIDPGHTNQVKTEYKDFNSFGQATKVEVTARNNTSNTTRNSQVTYTASGRFVQTRKNVLGETTTYNWNETKGVLNSETDYQGRTTSYQYDTWGRPVLITYPSGIKEARTLQWAGSVSGKPANAQYYAYSEVSGESPVIVWYDASGRELRRESYGLNKKKIYVDTEYNNKGQVEKVWEPYFSNETQVNVVTYQYDQFGRNSLVTTPMGNTSYLYTDTITRVTTPSDVIITTTNSAGWVILETTNGKSVSFTHDANGQVKIATPAGGPAITMEYDLQGNRTKLIDPDAGIITSQYDGWGQLNWSEQLVHKNTTTPIRTTYNYLSSGLLN